MKTGLAVGKFYPPHRGHKYLIDTAHEVCDYVTIMVVEQPGENPYGELRKQWLEEIYPESKVILVPDPKRDNDHKFWAKFTFEALGYIPDWVFTSEDYGKPWADAMGSAHYMVDYRRELVPVSGTAIRNDPLVNWEYLIPPARAYYAKRVCVIGAESTGSTTLAKALAEYYQTPWVPEFGRYYTVAKLTGKEGYTWETRDFVFIAEAQNAWEDEMARHANKILICDTDSFATAVWHRRYLGYMAREVEPHIAGREYDMYLLTTPDIEFEQDGYREGGQPRLEMHQWFIDELEALKKPYTIIDGDDFEKRFTKAVSVCNTVLDI